MKIERGIIKIQKKNIFWSALIFICCLITIEPEIFTYFTIIHKFFRIAQYGILFGGILLTIIYKPQMYFLSIIIIFWGYFLYVTFINAGTVSRGIIFALQTLGLLLILNICFQLNYILAKKILCIYFNILVYLNFLFMCLKPEGIISATSINSSSRQIYFLGVSNQLGPFFLIAAMLTACCIKEKKHLVWETLLAAVIYLTLIKVWSATSLLGITMFYIFRIFFYNWKWIEKLVIGWNLIFITLLEHIAIVFFRLQEKFSYIISVVLKKDITLSTRTYIWDKAFEQIKNSFLFGYGEVSGGRSIYLNGSFFNAHNFFVQILLVGGIILLFIIILIMILSVKGLIKGKQKKHSQIISIGIFSLFFMMLTEMYPYILIFLALFLGYICRYSEETDS